MASWSYNQTKKEMISYDDDVVAKWKAEWILKEGFGGSMFWELSGDKGEGGKREVEGGGSEAKSYVEGKSLVKVMKDTFGGLDQSQNWLRYEGSQFDNLKKGM